MFQKYPAEEFYRYMQFKRAEGDGKLATSATISSVSSAKIYEEGTTTDLSSSMLSNAAPYLNTYVIYKVKGGISGKRYTICLKVVDSAAQVFEGRTTMEVL